MAEAEINIESNALKKADSRAESAFGRKTIQWFISESKRPNFSHTQIAFVFFCVISRALSYFARGVTKPEALDQVREFYKHIACRCIDSHFDRMIEESAKDERKVS